MKEIIKILGNYKLVKKEFYFFIFMGILLETIFVIFPYFSKTLYEIVERSGTIEEYNSFLIFFLLFIILIISVGFLWEYIYNKIRHIFLPIKIQEYRKKLFNKSYADLSNEGTGKLISKIKIGTDAEIEIFISTLKILVNSFYRGILVIFVISFFLPELVLLIIFGIILIVIINYFLRKYIETNSKKEQEALENDGRNGARIIMENYNIRFFGKKEYELNRANDNLKNLLKYGLPVDIANVSFYKSLDFTIRILEVVIFYFIGTKILETGEYEISFLIMMTTYVWYLWWPIEKGISGLNTINRNWQKYISLQEFINKPNTIINGSEEYIYKTGDIEFKNINFGYNAENKDLDTNNINNIFNNLNLKFLEGKKNALVGHSGGGKSTVTKLILRLYDVNSGELLIDGQDIKSININSFYKKIGYLPQEPAIFDGTIKENLEYAFSEEFIKNNSSEVIENLIWKALEKARISKMIKKLENGLETEVGEKGIKLSGGEKQRLAIARIFLKDPEIIILDEPTSALDSISESKITESLEELTKDRTSIIIAHRLQTVMNSDKIIVLEDGEIESEGDHDYLINNSQTYKNLVDLQNGKIME